MYFWGGLPLVGLPLEPGLSICFLSVCIKTSNLNSKYLCFLLMELNKTLGRLSLDVCTLGPNSFLHLLYVCHSVSWLTSLLKLNKFRDILSSWRAICLKSVWRHSGDVNIHATNDSECHVCMSVCLFAYFLTKIRQRHISGSGRYTYLVLEFLEVFLTYWYTSSK